MPVKIHFKSFLNNATLLRGRGEVKGQQLLRILLKKTLLEKVKTHFCIAFIWLIESLK